MSDIKEWSPTAANNNSAPPDGWPENQLSSTVNNCARENMAAVRRWYEDAEWRDFGHTITYVSGTSFTINSDVTATYVANRRIRAVGSSTGTIYGTIDSSSFSSPDTTVTVTWDSGSLVSETLAVSLGVTPTNDSIPVQSLKGELPIANGGTGASTASGARTNLGVAFKGALLIKTSNQIVSSGSTDVITFDSENYDTDSFHSTSSNTSRITIPSGVSRAIFRAGVLISASGGVTSQVLKIFKNGSESYTGSPYVEKEPPDSFATQIFTPILSVTAGDYFELAVGSFSGQSTVAGSSGTGQNTWFSVEVVE